MPRALLSVSDKQGFLPFAAELVALGWELIASGGTFHELESSGIAATPTSAITQFPEMLGGRVKTLHPAIHAGILARTEDLDELRHHGYCPIDLVVCNLYPFKETVAQPRRTTSEIIEQIDIGGVALLRAAAKNYERVLTICDPNDYDRTLAEFRKNQTTNINTRIHFAAKAFAHTRDYDIAISSYFDAFSSHTPDDSKLPKELPERIQLELFLEQRLRYGENPHQTAAFYHYPGDSEVTLLESSLLGGKELSYNNLLDLDAAWRAACSFEQPTVVIVKHRSPTGIASCESLSNAFAAALASDPLSAFGGVIACNRELDHETVKAFGKLFIEAIAAPFFSVDAIAALTNSRPNCRLLQITHPYQGDKIELRSILGGILAQHSDVNVPPLKWEIVTQREPTVSENGALQFAWQTVRHVPSNAIVLARPGATVGIGGGLPSRVDAVTLACNKAGARARGAVLASDAFFPFADGLETAAQAGVSAVVQPGGSIRDAEVIEAANQANIAMVFTGRRHFRH